MDLCLTFGRTSFSGMNPRYNALDKMVVSTGTKAVINKMLIDQFIFVPICQILFYSGNSIMEVLDYGFS
jgi:hypothetical protein